MRAATLVSAAELYALIRRGHEVPGTSCHCVVVEASWAPLEGARDYLNGHIPGAIHFDTDDLENGYPQWRLRSPAELQHVIGHHGITERTLVVVYGSRWTAAARVWWVLKYAGVHDVRLLDGGFLSWTAAGYPIDTKPQRPQPAVFAAPVRTEMLATTDYIRARLYSDRMWLADVRSDAEYRGSVSGYSYADFKGRLPGAIPVGDAADDVFIYSDPDGRLHDSSDIESAWRRCGLVSTRNGEAFDREVIFYCGGGWRSSLAYLHAWLLGFRNIRNYSDGWCGWSTRYVPDAKAGGTTPGWRQLPTGNPISRGTHETGVT